jgi:predicted permease
MDALLFSLNAVFPLILLSAFGFYIKTNGTVGEGFIKDGNKFCFKYAFMALMFTTIYNIESFAEIRWQVVIFALSSVLVLFFIGLVYIIFFVKSTYFFNS